jgi:hypothetical protein
VSTIKIMDAGELKPVRDMPVPDLWHLGTAIPKLVKGIEEAKAADDAVDGVEVLFQLPEMNGERAGQAVIGIWHQAHSLTKALLRVEGQINEALRLLDLPLAEGFVLEKRLREVLTGALEGKEVEA